MGRINYNEVAREMIHATARSEAQVMSQWGEIAPLNGWYTLWKAIRVPNQQKMEQALERQLRQETREGLVSPLGEPFGGFKLVQNKDKTWTLALYSQLDRESLMKYVEIRRQDEQSGT